jgi:BCD family chlorophyll transporter-like MFS transporter
VAVGLGTAGFSMQDILLEPYGGEILKLTVGETTALTAIIATGTLIGFAVAARRLAADADPYRLAAYGVVAGLLAFSAVIFSAPLGSAALFRVGTALIGFGGGLFAVGTLTAAMTLGRGAQSGLALGPGAPCRRARPGSESRRAGSSATSCRTSRRAARWDRPSPIPRRATASSTTSSSSSCS